MHCLYCQRKVAEIRSFPHLAPCLSCVNAPQFEKCCTTHFQHVRHDIAFCSSGSEISEVNKGRKILEKMGWKRGEGLGKDGAGMKDPVSMMSEWLSVWRKDGGNLIEVLSFFLVLSDCVTLILLCYWLVTVRNLLHKEQRFLCIRNSAQLKDNQSIALFQVTVWCL